MRAWYDIVSLDAEGRADAEGIGASSEIVDRSSNVNANAGSISRRS